MPRNSTLPSEKILEIFLDHKDLFAQIQELPKKSDPFWSELSHLIFQTYPATPVTIYTWFVCNRFQLRDHFFVISPDNDSSDPESDEDWNSEDGLTNSENDEKDKGNTDVSILEKDCHISGHEWTEICPSKVNQRDKKLGSRTRLVLKKDWVHLVCRKFYEATRLPCCLKMQRHRVHVEDFTGKISVTFKGRCSFCSSTLTGEIHHVPDGAKSEGIPLHFQMKGSFAKEHPDRKRPLSAKLRTAIQHELKSKTANLLQNDMANSMMDFTTDTACPLVPKLTTLRRAKADSNVKTRFDTDPTYALFKAKYSADFVNIIQDIGLDPFYVHYYSRQQVQVFNQYVKNPTAFFNSESMIAIDATGGVVRHVKKPNDVKSKAIFLYDINMHNKNKKKILTVGSMLSEKHDTVALTNFFLNWIKFGAMVPKIVVVDMSFALMSACVKSFTQFSGLGEYLTNCGCIIDNPDSFVKPHTYLKNDVAHSVKLITGFSSLKNVNSPRTKAFFVRSICLILRETELKNVAEIIRHIFTVALHESEGVNVDGIQMPSELSKNVLQTMIGNSFNPTTFEEISTNELGEIEDLFCLPTSTMDAREGGYLVFRRWAASIKESVVEEMRTVGVGNRGNQQYLPGVVEDILYLCRLLPVWSAIMVPYFGYGSCTTSSCAVETNFGILKNTIFRHELPCRIDHFVTKHIRYNQGNILTNFQFEDSSTDTKSKDFEIQFEDSSIDTKPKDTELQYEDSSIDTKSKDRLQCEDSSIDTKPKDSELQCEDSSIDTKPKDFELHFEEGWGGLNEVNEGPMTKRKRTSYLEPNAEWEHIDLSTELKTVPIGILKNGSRIKGPIQIEKDKYILTNTCGFDSLIQILATTICDSTKYKEELRELNGIGMLAADVVLEIVENGITQSIYKKRAIILKNMYGSKDTFTNLKLINSATTISNLIEKLFQKAPSVQMNYQCLNCSAALEKGTPKELLELFVPDTFSMGELEAQIMNNINENIPTRKICSECNNVMVSVMQINSHLLVNVCQLKVKKFRLCDIPKTIKIKGRVFKLRGVVGYQGERYAHTIGHFVAYTLRENNHWQMYNDLCDKSSHIPGKTDIYIEVMVFSI